MRAPPKAWRAALRTHLKRTFGHERLRDGQADVIDRVMAGRHTLAVMPTGAGKSLCYQLPALLLPGRTVVVSPLIALMKDQRDKLVFHGVDAVQLNSATDAQESAQAEAGMADGSARIIFTTPERLADPETLALLRAHPVSLLVIDEAHCISQWGHDFRPAFLEIGAARTALGDPVVLGLTATATDDVIADVAEQLGLGGALGVVHTGVYRPNLHHAVEQVTNEDERLARVLAIVGASAGCCLVYGSTVKAVDLLFDALLRAGESISRYHGRLGAGERRANQDAFMRGDVRVMVATNAFGLGIDKPDVRLVLHAQMPSGLDAYYQESGRGGRDGQDSTCTLLYLHRDKAVQQFFLANRYPGLDDLDALYRALQAATDAIDLDALADQVEMSRTKLEVALGLLRRGGVVQRSADGRFRLVESALDDAALETLLTGYRDRREHDRAMLERMVFYGQTASCRWKVLLEHFDEADGFDQCGACDNCLRQAERRRDADLQLAAEAASTPVPSPQARHAPGDRVRVPRYGVGQVSAADATQVTVTFHNGEQRSFLAGYVRAA